MHLKRHSNKPSKRPAYALIQAYVLCGHAPRHMQSAAVPPAYEHTLLRAHWECISGWSICMWLFWPLFPGAGPQGTAARLGDGARVHFRPSACLCTRILKSKGERRAAISILSVCLSAWLFNWGGERNYMPARFLDPYSSSAYTAPGLNMRGNGGKCVYLYFFLKSATGSGRRLEVPVFTFCQARSRRRFLIYFIFYIIWFWWWTFQ